jgi:ribosomal protein L11 methyltransferase
MNWKQICIHTTEEAADLISSVLIDAGATGVEMEGGSIPVAHRDEYIAQPMDNSSEMTVKAYYGEDGFADTLAYVRSRLSGLKDEPGIGPLSVTVNTVADTDWNENFKKNFTTFRAAGCFVVKPTWEDYVSEPGDIIIEIDPGMAFGSGVHETTRMCLELLQKYMPPKAAVLDVGCGSGILGIGAAKLGAKSVLALDNDNVSVGVARDNALSNGADVMDVRRSDLLQNATDTKFDIIIANIIADIVIRLNENAGNYLDSDGVYIMSGIIDDREDDVKASLEEHGFSVVETLSMADWRAIAARKR